MSQLNCPRVVQLTIFALVCTGALVAKAAGLGYNPTSSAVLQLLARERQLALMPTDVAWYVTSNMSSQISSR